jgi:signal transduction histidine kinase
MRGELFLKAINAQEEERKRIARELHDDTSQSLAALLYAVEESLEMDEMMQIHKRLEGMHGLVQHTLDGVHKMIFDLRPSMLDHLGLVPALRWFAETRLEPRGVRVSVDDLTEIHRLPPELETPLFRVAQEAVLNIARHAAARNVCIRISATETDVRLEVEDDGIGFDVGNLSLEPDSLRGMGLLGMQERLELLGGELEIQSVVGSGTTLSIRVPCQERTLQIA